MSNSQRVIQQYAVVPVAGALSAAVAWPVSYSAAQVVVDGAGFADFWLAALSVVTFIGAVFATGVAVIGTGIAIYEWLSN